MLAFIITFWLSIFLVVYTYAGYPLIIAFLAKLKPVGFVDAGFEPFVTLLITAYNEEAVIAKKIDNSLLLDYPREKIQIIIATDGSSDSTPEIVRSYSDLGVELNFIPQRSGKIVAMNRAVAKAQGDIIVFSDANNMYQSNAIRHLVAPFCDSSVGATTGAKLIVQDGGELSSTEGIYWKYESWIKKNETAFSSCISAVGEILAVRRELYTPPPSTVINDDYYIVLDLIKRGFRVSYVSAARSFEYISATVGDEITRRARMSTGKFQAIFTFYRLLPFRSPVLLWQILSHKYFRAFLPFGFIGAFLMNILIVVFSLGTGVELTKYYGWLLTLQLGFYAMAFIGSTLSLSGIIGKVFYIPTYLVNSNLAVLKGFYGFITRRQTNIWERVRRGNT